MSLSEFFAWGRSGILSPKLWPRKVGILCSVGFVVAGWIRELVSCFYSYCMFFMLNMLGDAQVNLEFGSA